MKKNIEITFLGAAGTITGSKILIHVAKKNILIDCGLFQGVEKDKKLNYKPLIISPKDIDVVLLSHGHLDHCGLLPHIVKESFKGPIFCSEPTSQIAKIVLRDSAKIQDRRVELAKSKRLNHINYNQALYSLEDVENTIPLFVTKKVDHWFEIYPDINCCFRYAGHIIGATHIELCIFGKTLFYSGDIGRANDEIMFAPTKPKKADILFIESTYGNRIHPLHPELKLSFIIHNVIKEKQTLLIPAFAVERMQLLIFTLWKLLKNQKIPNVKIYSDSPMGVNVMDVLMKNPNWHKVSTENMREMLVTIKNINNVHDSVKIMSSSIAKVIIAASGMISGGRIMQYLSKFISDEHTTLLFSGYQADGTLGSEIKNGIKEISIQGKLIKVKAKIENLDGLSAHADQNELLEWMNEIKVSPEKIFIMHGNIDSSQNLAKLIREKYAWSSVIPYIGYRTSI